MMVAGSSLIVGLSVLMLGPADGKESAKGLRTTKPVVCRKVDGFASFEELPGATLTADDKLTIYYEPSGYTIEKTKQGYRSLFLQDGRVRKKGRKEPLWTKDKMFEYEAKNRNPPYQVYIRVDVSIKGLPPGDYEFDLTLHDGLKPEAETVARTVAFKVVEAATKD